MYVLLYIDIQTAINADIHDSISDMRAEDSGDYECRLDNIKIVHKLWVIRKLFIYH